MDSLLPLGKTICHGIRLKTTLPSQRIKLVTVSGVSLQFESKSKMLPRYMFLILLVPTQAVMLLPGCHRNMTLSLSTTATACYTTPSCLPGLPTRGTSRPIPAIVGTPYSDSPGIPSLVLYDRMVSLGDGAEATLGTRRISDIIITSDKRRGGVDTSIGDGAIRGIRRLLRFIPTLSNISPIPSPAGSFVTDPRDAILAKSLSFLLLGSLRLRLFRSVGCKGN